jgi:hypothetical protein
VGVDEDKPRLPFLNLVPAIKQMREVHVDMRVLRVELTKRKGREE